MVIKTFLLFVKNIVVFVRVICVLPGFHESGFYLHMMVYITFYNPNVIKGLNGFHLSPRWSLPYPFDNKYILSD